MQFCLTTANLRLNNQPSKSETNHHMSIPVHTSLTYFFIFLVERQNLLGVLLPIYTRVNLGFQGE